ncbi:MAG: VOC family protein [Deltaproteobacteria bacterium]|nr:VOC family protein [Deltaproteobacteria bacterium]
MFTGINHLAFITRDMDKTIRFYRDLLGLPLVAGVGNSQFKHYFFKVSEQDQLAFFAYDQAAPMVYKFHGVPTDKPLGFDHVSLGVDTKANLFAMLDRLEAAGFKVTGPVDHGFGWSIYFFDPNNIPLEITWQNLEIVKPPVLADGTPTEAAREGSDPVPGHWPEVSKPTPADEWHAYPGAGFEIRPRALDEKRGRAAGE